MTVHSTIAVAWGIKDLGVIQGIPEGAKWRVRMRAESFATIFIQHNGKTSMHCIESVTGNHAQPWKVGFVMGRNERGHRE